MTQTMNYKIVPSIDDFPLNNYIIYFTKALKYYLEDYLLIKKVEVSYNNGIFNTSIIKENFDGIFYVYTNGIYKIIPREIIIKQSSHHTKYIFLDVDSNFTVYQSHNNIKYNDDNNENDFHYQNIISNENYNNDEKYNIEEKYYIEEIDADFNYIPKQKKK
jgi:hypothetical protein